MLKVEDSNSSKLVTPSRANYGLGAFITNEKDQELRIRTKGDMILFEVVNGTDRAVFEVTYHNREIMENLRKSFADVSAHATKNRPQDQQMAV